MSPRDQAATIFRGIRGNPALIKIQRDNYAALLSTITGANGGFQIGEANVNGQSFSGKHTQTSVDRLAIFKELMPMLDRDSAGSKATLGRFL